MLIGAWEIVSPTRSAEFPSCRILPPRYDELRRRRLVLKKETPKTLAIEERSACKDQYRDDDDIFPSSQRRARSASPIGRSLKSGCAERSEGADGVVGSEPKLRRADHPGAQPAAAPLPSSARRGG